MGLKRRKVEIEEIPEGYEHNIIPIEGTDIEGNDEEGYWVSVPGIGNNMNGNVNKELLLSYKGVNYINRPLDELLERDLFPHAEITEESYQHLTDTEIPSEGSDVGKRIGESLSKLYDLDLVIFPNGLNGISPFILKNPRDVLPEDDLSILEVLNYGKK